MPVTFPDELLERAKLTESRMKLEVALTLFQQERITFGRAAAVSGLSRLEFQRTLASSEIPQHYGLEDLAQDMEYVRSRVID